MTFRPSTRDLECIAIMGHARATTAQIAAALGITPDEFKAWAGRLVAARAAWVEPVAPPRPATPAPAVPTSPRIVAERLFEGEPKL